jgi:Uncharacterized protein conserved in bacteria (DUF2188)
MATQGDDQPRGRVLRVGQVSGSNWTLSVDDDPTAISEHRTRSEAVAAARTHAETYGYGEILVYDNDGNQETIVMDDVDAQPGYPGAARGDTAD